jgi:hypothetical protein
MSTVLRIDVWGDVVCPFCYLGKRQLELAVSQFDPSITIEMHHRAFELDVRAPEHYSHSLAELLSKKYGMTIEQAETQNVRMESAAAKLGMTWNLDRCQPSNTFNAHRLIALAASQGLQDAMIERLFQSYFCEGGRPADRDLLVALANEVGVTDVVATLESERFAAEVRQDELDANELGITGVPSILIDGRFMVMGAQGADEILSVMERAWARRQKEQA